MTNQVLKWRLDCIRKKRAWRRDKASGQFGHLYDLIGEEYCSEKIQDDESWIFAEAQLEFREKDKPKTYRRRQIDRKDGSSPRYQISGKAFCGRSCICPRHRRIERLAWIPNLELQQWPSSSVVPANAKVRARRGRFPKPAQQVEFRKYHRFDIGRAVAEFTRE